MSFLPLSPLRLRAPTQPQLGHERELCGRPEEAGEGSESRGPRGPGHPMGEASARPEVGRTEKRAGGSPGPQHCVAGASVWRRQGLGHSGPSRLDPGRGSLALPSSFSCCGLKAHLNPPNSPPCCVLTLQREKRAHSHLRSITPGCLVLRDGRGQDHQATVPNPVCFFLVTLPF